MQDKFDPEKRFNERAKVYDADILKIIPGYHALHDTTRHLLETALPEDAFLLVAGVGTGNEAITLVSRNHGWRVTGFDIAENMIKTTAAKVRERGLNNRIALVHGTVDDILQESFDAATAILVMHFIPYGKKLEFLQGLHLRLNPGGMLILADFTGDRNSHEFKSFLTAWENYMLETREREDVDEAVARTRHDLDILSHEAMLGLIKKAGFINGRLFWKSLVFSAYVAERGE